MICLSRAADSVGGCSGWHASMSGADGVGGRRRGTGLAEARGGACERRGRRGQGGRAGQTGRAVIAVGDPVRFGTSGGSGV